MAVTVPTVTTDGVGVGGGMNMAQPLPTQEPSKDQKKKKFQLPKHYHILFGDRKRVCLYCLLVFLGLLVMMNIGLTLWLITALRLNVHGSGPISFEERGLQIRGATYSLGSIFAKEIRGRPLENLNLTSDKNIVMTASETSLHLKHNAEVITKNFTVSNTEGVEIFSVTSDGIRAPQGNLVGHSLSLHSSVETPLVTGKASETLVLESLTRGLRMTGPKGVELESSAGGVNIKAYRNIKLNSKEGKIELMGSDVRLTNIPIGNMSRITTVNPRQQQRIYQVCVCESGKLFLALARDHCHIQESLCQ